MTIVFINPNLLVQRNDPFTTGIVYMPIGLAYTVASVRQHGAKVKVIDAFGEAPKQRRFYEKFMVLGLNAAEIVERIPGDSELVCVYANQLINHAAIVEIISVLKTKQPTLPILLLENTQAVTAYDLRSVAGEFFEIGADYVLSGEAEERLPQIIDALTKGSDITACDGLFGREFSNPAATVIQNLDDLPFPAWDLFPVKNYWALRFAHGPQSSKYYLPILTSRGCPYPCRFCVIPATNFLKWRARSPESIVREMSYFQDTLGVREFHVEDVDPTVNDKRTRALCHEIISRKLDVIWKIVAGTKVETMRDETTINLMYQAGCRYISISPESGSTRVLELMRKPFKVDHAIRLIHQMNKVGIRSQACFVLGFPGETDDDRFLTAKLARRLTYEGLDEIAIFIISPVPGAAIFKELNGYNGLSELNFTPSWRADYAKLNQLRISLYRNFILGKLRYHPFKVLKQCVNFLRRRFETKMEMVPYKAIIWKLTEYFSLNRN